jgi:uncharacterized damage-inducible protein DinB
VLVNAAMLTLARHKTWAALRLIEYCEALGDEQLDATIPGTYGTVRETLRHIVDSDEGYFSQLTRRPFRTRAEAAAFDRPDPMPDGPVPLAELAERVRGLGPLWEAMVEDPQLANREITTTDGLRVPAAVPLAQSIHHADDHRSQVMSILGALGLETPGPNGLDMWGFAEATGQIGELESSSQ